MEDKVHDLRKSIDANIKQFEELMPELTAGIREAALVRTKLQEGKMWAGKILEELGSELPAQFQDKAE